MHVQSGASVMQTALSRSVGPHKRSDPKKAVITVELLGSRAAHWPHLKSQMTLLRLTTHAHARAVHSSHLCEPNL